MRLYIRNKIKYDPLNTGKPLIFVDFPDPRGFSVGQVKEAFKKKARAAKVDSLYHHQHDGSYEVLADDRNKFLQFKMTEISAGNYLLQFSVQIAEH